MQVAGCKFANADWIDARFWQRCGFTFNHHVICDLEFFKREIETQLASTLSKL